MEQLQAQQIWQRAHPPAPPGHETDLRALLQQVRFQQSISRQLGLAALEKSYAACASSIRGMLVLSGKMPTNGLPPIPKLPRRQLLTESFRRSRDLVLEFTARSALPDFGTAFRTLAQDESRRQLEILEQLGG